MNTIILMGRLTKDPEVRYGSQNNTAVARFSIAVNRRFKREGQPEADFFNCISFGKTAEFIEKYLQKGSKVVLNGELHNNNYTNSEGQKVYGMQVLINTIEFAESKSTSQTSSSVNTETLPASSPDNGFMDIPDIAEDELPFA